MQKAPRFGLAAAASKRQIKARIRDIIAAPRQKVFLSAAAVLLAAVLCLIGCTDTLQNSGAQTPAATEGPAEEDTPAVVTGFFPQPDEINIYYNGKMYTVDSPGQVQESVNMLNANSTTDNEQYAALAVDAQLIEKIETAEFCVVLNYDRPVQLENMAQWAGVDSLMVQLSGDENGQAGLLYYAADGAYASGPMLAYDEAGLAPLLSYFAALLPEEVPVDPVSAISRIDSRFDAGDIAPQIITYQAQLQPGILNNPAAYEVIFYQSVPFENGKLVLAEFKADGESHPELYLLRDGAVVCSTVYSYAWGINYTVLEDHTIFFGVPELVLSSSGTGIKDDDLTDDYRVSAEFTDKTVTVPADNAQGFILDRQGLFRPLAFRIENSRGKTLLDIQNIYQTVSDFGKYGLARAASVLNYCPMTTPAAMQAQITIDTGTTQKRAVFGQLHQDAELPLSYLWMDVNAFPAENFNAGQKFDISGDVQIYEYFWLDLGQSGPDSSFDSLLMDTGRNIPEQSGFYLLVFNTDLGYYTIPVEANG